MPRTRTASFLPSIGRIRRLSMPQDAAGEATVRVDTGVVEGSEISRFYDPMIAKIVTHGPDRAAAVEAMSIALDEVAIEGIRHNGTFLSALMAHPRWREGNLSTGFIAEEFADGPTLPATDEIRRLMAAVAFAEAAREALRRSTFGSHPTPVPGPLAALFDDGNRIEGTVSPRADGADVTIDGETHVVVRERCGLGRLARYGGRHADLDGLWRDAARRRPHLPRAAPAGARCGGRASPTCRRTCRKSPPPIPPRRCCARCPASSSR